MSLSIITSSWTAANVNWNSQPSTSCFSGCGEIDAGLVTKGQTFTTDVSSMVNQAYAAGQFYGIKIAPNPTCGSGLCEDWYVDYYSQLSASTGPILTITYTYTPSSATLCAGQQAPIMVTMNNRGSTIWQPSTSLPTAPFRLGSQNPPDNTLWGNSRIDLTSAVSVQSNSVFSFTVTAPSTTGTYNLQYQMVQDYPETWFGDLTSNIPVTVTPPCQPDFTLTATNPPAANAGSTAITLLTNSPINSSSGTVSLTDTVPTGLSCGTINPSTVTSSGGSAVSY